MNKIIEIKTNNGTYDLIPYIDASKYNIEVLHCLRDNTTGELLFVDINLGTDEKINSYVNELTNLLNDGFKFFMSINI